MPQTTVWGMGVVEQLRQRLKESFVELKASIKITILVKWPQSSLQAAHRYVSDVMKYETKAMLYIFISFVVLKYVGASRKTIVLCCNDLTCNVFFLFIFDVMVHIFISQMPFLSFYIFMEHNFMIRMAV